MPESGVEISVTSQGLFSGGKNLAIDVAFPILHGPYGEDGTIQGLFEMIGQRKHHKNQQHQQQRSIVEIRCPLPTHQTRCPQLGIGHALTEPKCLRVLLPKTRQQHPTQLGHGPFKKQSRRVGLGSPNGQSKPHQSGNLLPSAQQPTR